MADTSGDSGSRSGNSANSKVTVKYTGITVATNGVTAKINNPTVSFYSTSGWSDSSNRVRCSGAAVTDETLATNTTFDGSPTTHTWSATASSVTLLYGSEATATFRGEVAGISFYENDNVDSWYGVTLTVHYPKRAYTAPATPTITLTRQNDTSAIIAITGNQNSTTTDKYWQYVDWQLQTDDSSFSGGASGLSGTTTSISVASLTANRRYRVQARARNANATGAYGLSGYIYTTPSAPTLESAAWNATYTGIVLSWSNNATYSDKVEIERSVDGGGSWTVLEVPGLTESYTDTGIADPYSTTTHYRLRCRTPVPSLNSAYSTTLVVNPPNLTDPDIPIVILTQTSDTTAVIDIAGNQNNSSEDKYWQYVDWQLATDSGVFTGGASGLPGTTTSIPVTGLSANHRYRVQVRARNTNATGAYGQSDYIYTAPVAPILSAIWNPEDAGVDLSWTLAPYSHLVFIQRSLDDGAHWGLLAVVGGTDTYTDEGAYSTDISSIFYRVYFQTPSPAVNSPLSNTCIITVPHALYSGNQAVRQLYSGTDKAYEVYKGSKRIL